MEKRVGILVTDADMNRFWPKVNKAGSCWVWTGARFQNNYGAFQIGHKVYRAHRVIWTYYNGPIPEGLDVLHKCNHRWCVKPAHLKPGTHLDNMADRKRVGNYVSGPAHPNYGRPDLMPKDVPESHPRGKDHWTHKRPETVLRGSRAGRAQLSEQQVLEIRAARSSTTIPGLAKKYGVKDSLIQDIIYRRSWKHI